MKNILLFSLLLFALKASAYHTDNNIGKPYVNIADTIWIGSGMTANRLYLYHFDDGNIVTGALGENVIYFPFVSINSFVLTGEQLSAWNSTDTDGRLAILAQLVGVTIKHD